MGGGIGGGIGMLSLVVGAEGLLLLFLLLPLPFFLFLLLLFREWLPRLASFLDGISFVLFNHGWFKQSKAVALFDGVAFKQGNKKLAMSVASSFDMRYFSVNTFTNPHSFKFLMCFNSPVPLRKNWEEYRPDNATFLGMPPNNSMISKADAFTPVRVFAIHGT